MSDRAIGWAFVAGQIVLLGTLILLPPGDDFDVPEWIDLAADIGFWVGVALAVLAAVALGRSLTATPVPNAGGSLRTNGLYRYVRHPIYTGVIVIVVSLSVRSGSWIAVAIGAITLSFFRAKAGWEEQRLRQRYPDYDRYAAVTPRFMPHVVRRSRPTA